MLRAPSRCPAPHAAVWGARGREARPCRRPPVRAPSQPPDPFPARPAVMIETAVPQAGERCVER